MLPAVRRINPVFPPVVFMGKLRCSGRQQCAGECQVSFAIPTDEMVFLDADIAVAAYFPDVVAAWIEGAPIKIISPEATGAPDIFWFSRAGGPIHRIEDLHGSIILPALERGH